MKKSLIARTRERSQDAKNIKDRNRVKIRKTRNFKTSTLRESSNFERMKAEMIVLHDENVASKIQNVLHRVDSALERERERERKRERERAREREFTVVVEKRQNVISQADEEESKEREREKERERSRDRKRRGRDRDREQAVMSKKT